LRELLHVKAAAAAALGTRNQQGELTKYHFSGGTLVERELARLELPLTLIGNI